MFLFLPIKTDTPVRRKPVVNYALIVLNIVIFISMEYMVSPDQKAAIRQTFWLDGVSPRLYQFLTYAFLHGGWAHLLGNMLFLYIFGNSLNDKMGHLEYLLFYSAGAIFSGAGYTIFTAVPLIGASGAIAAVTTGFLVLFPRSNVLVVIWIFYFIDTIEFSSLFLIGFKMILLDNILLPSLTAAPTGVAYGAHLIGYLFGFIVPLILLAVRALERDQFDILALISRIWRRRQFAQVARKVDPFTGRPYIARPADVPQGEEVQTTPVFSEHVVRLRDEIAAAMSKFDVSAAAHKYRQLVEVDSDHVLARKIQLDIANYLMSHQNYPLAAEAYEKYLKHYSSAPQVEQVQLLLGIIYSRYLSKPDRAKDLLQQAKSRLRDPNQVTLCEEEIRKLERGSA